MRRLSNHTLRLYVWATTRSLADVRRDERGAVTTETAIITALVAGAALALGTFIVTRVEHYQDLIP